MSNIRFVWDPKKNVANKGKQGVSFEEAQTFSTTNMLS